jgi:hypothetical protein
MAITKKKYSIEETCKILNETCQIVNLLIEGSDDIDYIMKKIKEVGPNPENSILLEPLRRTAFATFISWSIPSIDVLNGIVTFINSEKVLEIGSGHGLWAKLLKLRNVNIVATDSFSTNYSEDNKTLTHIQPISANAAIKTFFDINVLMIVWPSYEDSFAFDSLSNFNGNKFVYIGEAKYGCCACDEFFKELNSEWELDKFLKLENWYGINDNCYLYTRKTVFDISGLFIEDGVICGSG